MTYIYTFSDINNKPQGKCHLKIWLIYKLSDIMEKKIYYSQLFKKTLY